MSDFMHDLRASFKAALNEWLRCRWLRGGLRCPDEGPF